MIHPSRIVYSVLSVSSLIAATYQSQFPHPFPNNPLASCSYPSGSIANPPVDDMAKSASAAMNRPPAAPTPAANKPTLAVPTPATPTPATSPNPVDNSCQGLDRLGNAYIISDNGSYLSRCTDCGSKDAMVISKQSSTFKFEPRNGKCAIRVVNSNYIARCNGCWGNAAYSDSVFNHLSDAGAPYAQWTVEKVGNKFAFKADTGKYMARCNRCARSSKYPDHPFVHATSAADSSLWTVKGL